MADIILKDSGGSSVDYEIQGFSVEDAATQRGVLRFNHIGTSMPLDWGDDVYVYDGVTKLWGGTVAHVEQRDITVGSTTTIRYTYKVTDFSELASRKQVAADYADQFAGAIVTAWVSALSPLGVTAGTIEDGAYIDSINFNYISYEMGLDELAEICGFYWNIDKNKALHFRAVDSAPAPFDLTASNKPYEKIRFVEDRTNYTNWVYLRAGTQLNDTDTVETQYGDGAKRSFAVGSPIGNTPTVEVDTGGGFGSQTVAVEGTGTSAQWYYAVDSAVITQDSGQTVLGATDRVRVTYKARYPHIVNAVNDAAIAERAAAEGTDGIYMAVVDALEVNSADEAQLKANAILEQRSAARLTCEYETTETGLEAGMSQLVNLSDHGINARFLLESVTMTLLESGDPHYIVRSAATQTLAGWSYWKQKTRQDRKFSIRANEILTILKSPKEDMTLADAEPTYNTYAGAYTVNGADTYINGFHVG